MKIFVNRDSILTFIHTHDRYEKDAGDPGHNHLLENFQPADGTTGRLATIPSEITLSECNLRSSLLVVRHIAVVEQCLEILVIYLLESHRRFFLLNNNRH